MNTEKRAADGGKSRMPDPRLSNPLQLCPAGGLLLVPVVIAAGILALMSVIQATGWLPGV
jgi:hypothetical protein